MKHDEYSCFIIERILMIHSNAKHRKLRMSIIEFLKKEEFIFHNFKL